MIQTPRVSQRVLEPRQTFGAAPKPETKRATSAKAQSIFRNVFIETPLMYFNDYVNGLILSRASAMMGVF